LSDVTDTAPMIVVDGLTKVGKNLTAVNIQEGVSMHPQRGVVGSFLFLLIAVVLVIPACTSMRTAPTLVERGKYLVVAGGCNEIHSPKIFTPAGPISDTTRLLSGHPASSPLPPMPWQTIGQMTDDDLKAMFAYL